MIGEIEANQTTKQMMYHFWQTEQNQILSRTKTNDQNEEKKRKKVKCKISNIVVLFFIDYTTFGLTKLIDFDLLCYFNVYNKKKKREKQKKTTLKIEKIGL